MYQLFIGNKNYSSWSMRPWVLMTQSGIAFEEVMLRFDSFDAGSDFKRRIAAVNPVGKVPVLVTPEGTAVWDTLAIAETLAERHPDKYLWPTDPAARARARSVSAEMHSGFGHLRSHCPMNIEADLREVGARIWREQPAVQADVARLNAMWAELLAQHGGPLLFGHFTIADAMYAPVIMRLVAYGLPVPPTTQAYIDAMLALPGVAAWVTQAKAEHDFRPFEEPYRKAPAAP